MKEYVREDVMKIYQQDSSLRNLSDRIKLVEVVYEL